MNKSKFVNPLLLIIFLTLSFTSIGQDKNGIYLNNVKNKIIQRLKDDKNSNNIKKACVSYIFNELLKDRRIIEKSDYFEIEIDIEKGDKKVKKVDYTYDFGTQASLTQKSFLIDTSNIVSVNYNFLVDFFRENRSIFDILNYKNNIQERKIIFDRINKLISKEYYYYFIESSFSDIKYENGIYIEEHTKIYNDWEKSIILLFNIKENIISIGVRNEHKKFKYSEKTPIPKYEENLMNISFVDKIQF